jgi:hypothetical protein
MSGKGSKPRPLSVPRKKFDENWDRIFGKKKEPKNKDKYRQTSRGSEMASQRTHNPQF